VQVRDEEWLVRSVETRDVAGTMAKAIGTSELVRDREATFLTDLDRVEPMRPDEVVLQPDGSSGFRRSRLYLEAILRRTPLPASEMRLAVRHRQLLSARPRLRSRRFGPAC
jgi:hypothetical protein